MDLSTLPPHLKLLILESMDTKAQTAAFAVTDEDTLLAPPVVFSTHLKSLPQLNHLCLEELHLLETRGYILKDNFVQDENASWFEKVKATIDTMRSNGTLKPAGMKDSGKENWSSSSIRGDLHCWINELAEMNSSNLKEILEKIDQLRIELNNVCDFNSHKTQAQIACYPGGGSRYVRHLDSTPNGIDRRLTCLLYLNKDWKPEDGGQLRIFLKREDGTEKNVDIEPLFNRLLIFQSRTIPHEVLASYQDRLAITMWFY